MAVKNDLPPSTTVPVYMPQWKFLGDKVYDHFCNVGKIVSIWKYATRKPGFVNSQRIINLSRTHHYFLSNPVDNRLTKLIFIFNLFKFPISNFRIV